MAGEHTMYVDISELNNLIKRIEDFSNTYPDFAGEALKEQAVELRNEIAAAAPENERAATQTKRSLRKKGSYTVSEPQKYGSSQIVEISAKSPHFHLIERGHRVLNRYSEEKGFKEGIYYLDKEVEKFEYDLEKLEKEMKAKLEEFLNL